MEQQIGNNSSTPNPRMPQTRVLQDFPVELHLQRLRAGSSRKPMHCTCSEAQQLLQATKHPPLSFISSCAPNTHPFGCWPQSVLLRVMHLVLSPLASFSAQSFATSFNSLKMCLSIIANSLNHPQPFPFSTTSTSWFASPSPPLWISLPHVCPAHRRLTVPLKICTASRLCRHT